ncbi:MAG: chemotaxis protein CheR [Telmatospirillum sp.]|nr:chemotaxis protein CheR [Telmatospirillum sp.]
MRGTLTPSGENSFYDPLSRRDFERLGRLIEDYCGIRMPPSKHTMVEGRLRRRVKALNLANLSEYCRYVLDQGALEQELVNLIDAVTTNKTDFFREPQHFRFLMTEGIQSLMALPHRPGIDRPMRFWSAACASGAEPYTLSMVLHEVQRANRGFRFEIFATDICTEVLTKAKMAIYPEFMASPVPTDIARRYFLRSQDRETPTLRLMPRVRQSVRFGHLNLMDPDYGLPTDMDVIFCRNILIYFEKQIQCAVLAKLCRHLRPGGYLLVGHSETISGFDLPIEQIDTAIFRRR